MIKKNQRLLNAINVVSDGVIVLFSCLFSARLWLQVLQHDNSNIANIVSMRQGTGVAAILYVAVMTLILALLGVYAPARTRRLRNDVIAIVEATSLGILSLGAILYLLRVQEFSRGVLGLFGFFNILLLLLKRLLLRKILVAIRQRGFNQKHVIVIGSGPLARQYTSSIADAPELGYHIDGYVGTSSKENPMLQPIIPNYQELDVLLRKPGIDEVIIALEPSQKDDIFQAIGLCEKNGTKVSILPFYNRIIPAHPTIEIIGQSKLISLRSNRLDNLGYAFIKRAFDIIISAILLVVLSPLLLIAALGVLLSSPGPILFKQERVGLNKRVFSMLKFRSMRVNANETSGWTQRGDPRRTRFGTLLRKLSIDELPQLINVLKGDMSLVGPRPEIPYYVDQYRENIPLYMVKHQIRPGLTGWAQVHGFRGDTSIEERIRHDIWYIENWSILLDLRIILLTILGGWYNREEAQNQSGQAN